MPIRLIHGSIAREELADLAKEYFEELIKGVVDAGREVVALGGSRALELVELTIDAQAKGARARELCRFHEVVGSLYCGSEEYPVSLEWLAGYSMEFALIGRKQDWP